MSHHYWWDIFIYGFKFMIYSKDFITSDIHFEHKNIIEYSNRPFSSVEEMNDKIINNWNNIVPHDGRVYFVGDFCLSRPESFKRIRNRLNGSICLIKGNHDKINGEQAKLFEWVKDYHSDNYEDEDRTKIIMCHYAFRVWDKSHFGSVNFFGHSHGSLPDLGNRQFDVGIDNNSNYEPWNIGELMKIMMARPIHKVDHHDPKNHK